MNPALIVLLFTPRQDIQLIVGIILLIIIIIIGLIGGFKRDPNKWYGEMVCLTCNYKWQSRRNTPPARCPSCRSKSISVVKGDGAAPAVQTPVQTSYKQSKSKGVTAPTLQSFFSFAGFQYGDSITKALKLLGAPQQITDNPQYSLVSNHYFVDEYGGYGLTLHHKRDDERIVALDLVGAKTIGELHAKRIYDKTFFYLGRRWDTIREDFGEPTESVADTYGYDIYQTQNLSPTGQVVFSCYEHDNQICSAISVYWFYLQ
jgi:DNA-directed RNA polymerase subunit RPC12/RpoP